MRHLTREQRYTISAMYKQGCTQKMIAQAIGKDKSVVSRELKRNRNEKGKYRFSYAQNMAEIRKERSRQPRKLKPGLKRQILRLLEEQWSPQQIEGRLKLRGEPYVSHETIYKIIRADKAAGGKLYLHTRHKMKHRKRKQPKSVSIKNRVGIEQRPPVVDLKQRFADWEMDTIIGKNGKGAILTLVERTTAFCMAQKLPKGKNAKELSKIVYAMLLPYKVHVHTITVDNGSEFAEHQTLAEKLNTQIYFTHPYSSWEKGLIENTNKLIRQYIPKKSNFNEFSNNIIKQIQYRINERPRYKLNFYSPKEIFFLNLKRKVAFNS